MMKYIMKTSIIRVLFILTISIGFNIRALAQSSPFEIYIEPLTVSGLPGVQSFAFGQDDGKWLIVGGRLDGLHKSMGMGMMGTPFPASSNNNQFIVVDPVTAQKWTASLSSLSVNIQEQLSSTNTEYFQEGNYLYVIGGYGYKISSSTHKTFDKLTAIDVPNVITAVINGTSFSSYIRQITDADFQVTGGQLEKIYDTYYLVGGQNFDGTYTSMTGMGMFTQTYSNQIKKFQINDNGSIITISHLPSITDTINLHRRDYNMVSQIMPDGKEGLTAFSGVFQYSADIPYLNCVNIDSSGYAANNAFSEYYNNYQCANLPVYSAANNEMHTLFFGGIAQYFDSSGILTQDNNVPFVNTIARVTRTSNGTMSEYKLPVEMPSLLGAGSEFIPVQTLPYYANGVLQLDNLTADTTLVGYIFGGISSPSPNVFTSGMMGSNGTSAVSQIFKVHLVRNTASTSIHQLNAQSNGTLQLQVSPNPNNGILNLNYNITKQTSVLITITDNNGKLIKEKLIKNPTTGKNHLTFSDFQKGGIYFVTLKAGNDMATQKIIINAK